ncbi:MFS transporter [Lentibacillus cibarius]|uniref:MFS transporter n=1 Tax=Lentibacillus cibarius TaxID=2583219 RepID=A0A549YHV3_9BACI|nr:MFS transporter [Lentibacillus cibarius]TRM11456.1 MFS transporter [Lentibacillus cibarius]
MSVLRNRNFAILFFGQMISAMGNNLFMIAFPWLVYSMTGSKTNLALTGIVVTVPGIFGLFIGVFIDRWRKKHTMIISSLFHALISLALHFVVLADTHFVAILGLVLFMQFAGTFYRPAEQSLIPLILPQEQLTSAMGLVQSGGAAAKLTGVLLGGMLIGLIGAPLLFLLNAIAFGLTTLTLCFINIKETVQTTFSSTEPSFFKEWLDGLRTIIKIKLIFRIALAAMVANFAVAPVDIVMTAWVQGPLQSTALTLAAINASIFLGIILGGALLGYVNKRIRLKTVLLSGLIVAGASVSLIGVFPVIYWATGLGLIFGYTVGTLNGSIGALAVQVIPENKRGHIFATMSAISTLAIPLGMAVYGGLMVYVPLQWMYILIGVPAVLSGLSFLLPIKKEPSSPQQQLAEVERVDSNA